MTTTEGELVEMAWDPITRIVGSLGIYTKIDFDQRRVAECPSTPSIFRGYSIFMKGKDPRDAHLITSRMLDFIEFDDGFAIAKVRAPQEAVGRTLADAALRTHYGITVVGVKMAGEDFVYARPETVVDDEAMLIVAGRTNLVEHFAAVT